MKVLALDLSTKTGWAILSQENDIIRLLDHGLIQVTECKEKQYPWSYLEKAKQIADGILQILPSDVDHIVIEETNGSRARFTQKMLEFIHAAVLSTFYFDMAMPLDKINYVDTSQWRKVLGITLNKEQKKANAKLSKAKRKAITDKAKLDKKALGIRGKITPKHLSVIYANETYGLNFKVKDNDRADALALGTAFLKGAKTHRDKEGTEE